MANSHRGEIEALLDGKPHRMCLTLGALAELESAFGDDDMLALAERFGRGRLSARDAMRILAAGLRGAGLQVSDEAVSRMQCDGGATGYVDIVARLLAATFGTTDTPAKTGPAGGDEKSWPAAREEERRPADPFPGTR